MARAWLAANCKQSLFLLQIEFVRGGKLLVLGQDLLMTGSVGVRVPASCLSQVLTESLRLGKTSKMV